MQMSQSSGTVELPTMFHGPRGKVRSRMPTVGRIRDLTARGMGLEHDSGLGAEVDFGSGAAAHQLALKFGERFISPPVATEQR